MASAAPEDVNMSLDDLIKKRKMLSGRGRRGGRGGAPRGRGGAPSSSRGGSGFRRGAPGGSRGGAARIISKRRFQPEAGDGSWQHDKFGGASPSKRGRIADPGSSNASSSKLIISNLDYGVSDNDIQELFREFGVLRRSAVHYDRSGRSLGTAEVSYANPRDAQRALSQYNNVPLDGRPMRIQFATQTAPAAAASPPAFRPSSSSSSSRPRGGPIRRGSALRGRGGAQRGGRGRGGAVRKAPVTKEELDRQMDEYNAQAQAQATA